MPCPQGRYWILTIPHHMFTPFLPRDVQFITGQLEQGSQTDYLHWQLMVAFKTKCRLQKVKSIFGDQIHAELSRSAAADDYCNKEDTRIGNTQFSLGTRAIKRNSASDWDKIKNQAEKGELNLIPADIYIRHYFALKKIKTDHEKPTTRGEVDVRLFLGPSGTGKTFAAWQELGTENTYTKIPTTKWWDGYQGETQVIVDEFRGQVSIGLLLRWLDPAGYPLMLETKGAQAVAKFNKIIITSNIHPDDWYPDLDAATKGALLRRIKIIKYNTPFIR